MARSQGKPVLVGSLDSLVSTCTNASAGLIIIALVTMITVGTEVREIVASRLGRSLSPEAVREIKSEKERVTTMLAEVNKVGKIPTVQIAQQEFGGQDIRDLVNALDRLVGDPEQLQSLKNGYELSRIMEYEQSNAAWHDLIIRMKGATNPARQQGTISKIVNLPDSREPRPGMTGVFFICQHERIFPFHVQALAKQFQSSVQRALGGVTKKIADADIPRIVQYFENNDIGDTYIHMKVDQLQGSLVVTYRNKRKDQGESIEQIRRADSQFARTVRSLDPEKNFIRFVVWSDSFDLYNEARQMVSEQKFMAGWEPQDKDDVLREIIFDKGGSIDRPTVD